LALAKPTSKASRLFWFVGFFSEKLKKAQTNTP
jgi:hypothetical protein